MSRAVLLYERHTLPELQAMMRAVMDDPASTNPQYATGSIHLYTKAARKKMDDISWAITWHLRDKKESAA